MNDTKVAVSREVFRRLMRAIANFLKSPVGGKARWLLLALFVLMFGINSMNVANSFVGRHFMSAIESKDMAGFTRFAWWYVAVFSASTVVGVLFRFTEERLGLLWRDWLTRCITGIYIDQRLYLQNAGEESVSNPDQRMSEDVRQLTTTTLSFVLMTINATLTVLSFSGVLWTISPKLFMVAVFYALGGSILTIWLGRPLIRLNYRQSDYEANFRTELIHIREIGPQIAASGTEPSIKQKVNECIDSLVSNVGRIITVNRNLSFFISGYNYLIQLIPVLIVAPLFIQGKQIMKDRNNQISTCSSGNASSARNPHGVASREIRAFSRLHYFSVTITDSVVS